MIVNQQLARSRSNKVKDKDKWATPKHLFDRMDEEFGFTLDPCCEVDTAKCNKFYTPYENGLSMDWGGDVVFCNPPYSQLDVWLEKCYNESLKPNTIVVVLIPVSTSAKWWNNLVTNKCEIRFIQGRVSFVGAGNSPAPFSSVWLIYGNGNEQPFKTEYAGSKQQTLL